MKRPLSLIVAILIAAVSILFVSAPTRAGTNPNHTTIVVVTPVAQTEDAHSLGVATYSASTHSNMLPGQSPAANVTRDNNRSMEVRAFEPPLRTCQVLNLRGMSTPVAQRATANALITTNTMNAATEPRPVLLMRQQLTVSTPAQADMKVRILNVSPVPEVSPHAKKPIAAFVPTASPMAVC